MNREEFEKEKQKIKADFAQRRVKLAREETAALNNFKLAHCEIKAGDFVEFGGKTYKVLNVAIEEITLHCSKKIDVCARLERVKKDKTPTVRAEFELVEVDRLKKI